MKNTFTTIIWLALVLFTTMTYSIDLLGMSGKATMLALLAITMLKSQMVANYFMGLRNCGALWRSIMFGYFLIVGSLIAIAYLMAAR